MADGKQPLQADGGGSGKGDPDGVGAPQVHGRSGGGESGGGAYPNPHSGKTPKDGPDTFLGTGGQSGQGYSGGGQILGEKADDSEDGRVGQGG